MSRTRRIVFWVIALVFAGLCVGWTLWVPHDPSRIYRAVPGDAVLISAHDDLGGRWLDLCSNALFRTALTSAGVDPLEIHEITNDPEIAEWAEKLVGRETVVAFVPSLGCSGFPAWIVVTWVGGQSQYLRWVADLGFFEDIEAASPDTRYRIWTVDSDSLDDRARLSVALEEGILMGCFSEDPTAVRHVLMTYIKKSAVPSIWELGKDRPVSVLWSGEGKDRAWGDLGRFHPGLPASLPFSYVLSENTATRIAGRVRSELAASRQQPLSGSAGLRNLGRILGDIPEAVVLARTGYVRDVLPLVDFGDVEPVLHDLLASEAVAQDAAFALCLLGGDYSGRIKGPLPREMRLLATSGKGLRVPAVLLGVEVTDESASVQIVGSILDKLSVRHKLGVMQYPKREVGQRFMVFEASTDAESGNDYAGFEEPERLAYTVIDGWLLFCSNFDVLLQVTKDYRAVAALPAGPLPPWAATLTGDTSAYLWVDLDKAGVTVGRLLAVVKMWAGFSGVFRGKRAKLRLSRQLARAEAWIQVLRPFKRFWAKTSADGSGLSADFSFGE